MECKSLISDFQYFGVGSVDLEKGVIRDVAVVTEGEAKGHGVFLEAEFIQAAVEAGNARKSGIKARFGHPSMSSTALGTFLGRFKNFRIDTGPQGQAMCRADLFLSSSAKDTPQGDLYSYVLGLAEKDPEAFGASIVFEASDYYVRGEEGEKVIIDSDYSAHDKVYVEMGSLRAADLVDDPAANPDGLFSAWSTETFAGQVSEFLDTHPHVFELLRKKPEVVEGFMTRYQSYLERKKTMTTEKAEAEKVEVEEEAMSAESETETTEIEAPAAETEEVETEANEEQAEDTTEEAADAEETVEPEAESEEVADDVGQAPTEELHSGQDFLDAFGTQGGVWFAKGMTFAQAKDEYIKELEAQNAILKEQIKDSQGETPASFTAESETVGDFVAQAKALAAADGTGFTEAAKKLARENPSLYAQYRKGQA